MGKDTFIFYREWIEGLEDFDVDFKWKILNAVFDYALDGILPTDPLILYSPFAMMRKRIDKDNEKYQSIVLRNQQNGVKGGRPRIKPKEPTQTQITQPNPKNPVGLEKPSGGQITQITQPNPKNLDNDNDNDNDIVSEYKYSSTITSEANASVSTDVDAATAKKKDFFKRVFNLWNDKMQGKAIPTITKMTPKRKLMVNARRSEYGEQAILNAIQKVADSEYLNQGLTWFCFDWIFKPNNFPKVLEGNYDNAKQQYNPNNTTSGHACAAAEQRNDEFVQHILNKSNGAAEQDVFPIW